MDSVRSAGQNQQKVAFLVDGGPGTGKSVIAVNLVAELAALGLRTLHVTGSKAFTENLRKIVGGRAGALFKYFRDTATVDEPLDVVILDEAHRIRIDQHEPLHAREGAHGQDPDRGHPRLDAGCRCSSSTTCRSSDPGEVGSTDLDPRGGRQARRSRSASSSSRRSSARTAPTRSSSWVDNTLELDRTPQVLWPMDDDFDFRIVGIVRELDQHDPRQGRGGGDRPTRRRLLLAVVRPRRRRRARPGRQGRGLVDALEREVGRAASSAPGIPKSDFWASAKEGIDQVGCVYTAQGFEFDYVGVIFGPDLVYRPMDGGWVGQRDQSHDRVVRSGVTEQQFTDFVKSTYRVLLTRGLRGCYVYFMDAPTRDFFLSRIERVPKLAVQAAEQAGAYDVGDSNVD